MKRGFGRLLLASFAACGAATPAFGGPSCVGVPEGAADPVVTACDDGERYTFVIAGQTYEYDAAAYRAAIAAALRAWLTAVGADREAEGALAIDLWLSVPEANPEATAARFVVQTGATATAPRFIVSTSLHPAEWSFGSRDVAVLPGARGYPQDFGARVGDLLVKTASGAAKADVDRFLESHGLTAPEAFGSGAWSVYRTGVFDERRALAEVDADPERAAFVEKIDYNGVVEWIALRTRAFAFRDSP